jgi:hypothetical protein
LKKNALNAKIWILFFLIIYNLKEDSDLFFSELLLYKQNSDFVYFYI